MFIKVEDAICIGDKVVKKSGKPFKSGLKIGTVLEIVPNPYTGKPGIRIKEDNSIVDLHILCKYENTQCKE